ncbi:MAG: YihY/virulence factor BrkB family protein [Oscillospiraceae bacterium]|nr:YihY/virulence factor BrkB family protein [Oscillospiraceae bacterium]
MKKIFVLIKTFKSDFENTASAAYAAHACFFIFLSFFPFAMLCINLLHYLPFDIDYLLSDNIYFLSRDISALFNSIIEEVYSKSSGAVISIASVLALWSASKGFMGIIRGLNSVYSCNENRGYFKVRLTSLFYTIIMVVLLISALGFLVFFEKIGGAFKLRGIDFDVAIGISPTLRRLAGVGVLSLFFTFVYTLVPERKTRFLSELPGAVLSSLGWVIFSALYSFYINNLSDFNQLYGSLTAVVLFMLWLYFCMSILFFGAKLNVLLNKKFLRLYLRS